MGQSADTGPRPNREIGHMDHGVRDALQVFIADDNGPIAEMLTQLLHSPGRVEVVGVGATEDAAVHAIRQLLPDVVILDLQLKDGSGTNVIKAVRSHPELGSMRLLVTSNHDSPQLRAGCLELGANGYFDKVKELAQLTARVDELAEEKRARAR
jgi:two-component system, OmpR family, response regulator